VGLQLAPFDLSDTLGATLQSLTTQASDKGLELAYHVDRKIPGAIEGDASRLRQIVINLVGNAIKFTDEGEVTVHADVADVADGHLELHFSVSDTGPGVPLEEQERIFEAFEQAGDAASQAQGGTGLGLTIAARLVEAMGGRIWLDSEVGRGTTVHFTAEFRRADARPRPREMASMLEHLRVLVVDDNQTNRRMLLQSVRSWRMQAEQADGGEAALEAVEAARSSGHPYDVVLLDASMPDLDGEDVARRIRTEPANAELVIIMLSSGTMMSPETSRDLRIHRHLLKPVRRSDVLDAIAEAIGAARTDASSNTTEPVVTPSESHEGRGLRILVAEDSKINRTVVVDMLERAGHRVEVARDGFEAVDRWRGAIEGADDERFDLVLMDVRMPNMDGLAATAAIREQERSGQHTPIVALTAHAMKGDREACLAAGMDGYLAKPVRTAALHAAIAEHAGGPGQPAAETAEPTSPAPADDAIATFDRETALGRVGGDPTLLDDLMRLFVEDEGPRLSAALREGVERGDRSAVRRHAHSLKSSLALLGADAVATTCARLEAAADSAPTQQLVDLVASVEHDLQRLVRQFEDARHEGARG
jgi:CheY-like chemotaxis protein/HPt (histidine-containing phosphotransfer) domain-containing protein